MWHVSIARIDSTGTALVPVEIWPGAVMQGARSLADRMLIGAGGTWQFIEIGESAIHLRRRLSPAEMVMLHAVKPTAAVFEHGAAMPVVIAHAKATFALKGHGEDAQASDSKTNVLPGGRL